jgi:SAM-dependent methyltransferase
VPATTPAGFAADAYAGAAEDYLRYRLPYPNALLDDLLERVGGGRARLLDLGCGPGRLTLALADRFTEVWALDLEPEMIEVGRRDADRRGVANVHWIVGLAEELEAPAGAFDLVTAGEAFHRFDAPRMLSLVRRWLRPAGCLAMLGCDGAISGPEPWQLAAQAVVLRFSDRPSPGAPLALPGPAGWEALFIDAGFVDVASHAFFVEHVWSVEAVAGHLYSTSYCTRAALGDRLPDFEVALRNALLAVDPTGRFVQRERFGYTMARKA